ncbi:hypothetical protein BJX64DRAFT_284049 [Aspergillus heterothallicus]
MSNRNSETPAEGVLEKLRREYLAAVEKAVSFGNMLSEIERTGSSLESEDTKLDTAAQEMKAKIEELSTTIHELSTTSSGLSTTSSDLLTRIHGLTLRDEEISKEIRQLDIQGRTLLARIEAQEAESKTRVKGILTRISELITRIDGITLREEEIPKKIRQLDKQGEALLARLEVQETETKAKIEELSKIMSALSISIAGHTLKHAEVSDEIRQLDIQGGTLLASLEVQETETLGLQKRVEKLEILEAEARKNKSMEKAEEEGLDYVSMVIDANAIEFLNTFNQTEGSGGSEAARALTAGVREVIRRIDSEAPKDTFCKIYMYAKPGQLDEKYGAGFSESFEKGHSIGDLISVIEVPGEKEDVDASVQAMVKKDLANETCRYMVFCAPTNDSHAAFLEQCGRREIIALVQAEPFSSGIYAIEGQFRKIQFHEVFRTAKVAPWRKPDFPKNSPLGLDLEPKCNARGERIDSVIFHSSFNHLKWLRKQRFCYNYYLLGVCYKAYDLDHRYVHGPLLHNILIHDLLVLSRHTPCPQGSACRSDQCVLGHRCYYGPMCRQIDTCAFPKALHHIYTADRDQDPADGDDQIPADGDGNGTINQDSREKPVDENAEHPVNKNSEKPVDESTQKPIKGNAGKPVNENTEQPVDGNTQNPLDGDSANPASEGGTDSARGQGNKPALEDSRETDQGNIPLTDMHAELSMVLN